MVTLVISWLRPSVPTPGPSWGLQWISSSTITHVLRGGRCADSTSRQSPARRSWSAARAARSSTSLSTCAAPHPPSGSGGGELDDEAPRQLFAPVGFGHGFAVLSEEADVTYMLSSTYDPATESGIAWAEPD